MPASSATPANFAPANISGQTSFQESFSLVTQNFKRWMVFPRDLFQGHKLKLQDREVFRALYAAGYDAGLGNLFSMSRRRIQAETGVRIQNITDAFKRLEKAKFLEIHREGKVNQFRILLPSAPQSSQKPSGKAAFQFDSNSKEQSSPAAQAAEVPVAPSAPSSSIKTLIPTCEPGHSQNAISCAEDGRERSERPDWNGKQNRSSNLAASASAQEVQQSLPPLEASSNEVAASELALKDFRETAESAPDPKLDPSPDPEMDLVRSPKAPVHLDPKEALKNINKNTHSTGSKFESSELQKAPVCVDFEIQENFLEGLPKSSPFLKLSPKALASLKKQYGHIPVIQAIYTLEREYKGLEIKNPIAILKAALSKGWELSSWDRIKKAFIQKARSFCEYFLDKSCSYRLLDKFYELDDILRRYYDGHLSLQELDALPTGLGSITMWEILFWTPERYRLEYRTLIKYV